MALILVKGSNDDDHVKDRQLAIEKEYQISPFLP